VTIEQVIRVVFDDNAYTRNVAQAAQVSGRFDASVNSVTNSLLAMSASAGRAGAAQALAASSGGAFLSALQKQAATLTQQSAVIGKSEADLLRLKAAELGVAQQAGATITALEQQAQAITRLSAGAKALDSIRSAAAFKGEREAVEAGIAVDIRAGRAKEDLIAQIERETAALTRLTGAQKGATGAASGSLVDRVQAAGADDPAFAARAQPAIQNLGAAQAARDQQVFIAALERTANAAGRTRAELLALEAAEKGVSAQAAPLIARIASVDKQFQSFSKTGRLTALELQQVGFQVNDFFVQLASGGNPLIAFVQQGSQLSGTFGGMGNAVRALTSLITPLKVAFAGVGVLVAGIGAGFVQGQRQSKEFADAILLSGNAAGKTEERFNGLITTLSRAGELTRGAVREAGQAVIKTGEIGPQNFDAATEAVARFAAATGKSVDEAAGQIARLGREPAQAAKELNRTFNFLSAAQLQQIKNFEDQGRSADAAAIAINALNGRLQGLEANLGTLDRVVRGGKNVWDSFWDSVYAVGRTQTLGERLRDVQAQIAANAPQVAQENAGGAGFVGPRNPRRTAAAAQTQAELKARESTLIRQQDIQEGYAQGQAALAENERQYAKSNEFIKAVETRAKTVGQLTKALKEAQSQIDIENQGLRAQGKPELGAAREKAILAQVRKDNTPTAEGGDPDKDIKRTTALAIESARRAADATKAGVEASNEALRAEYEEGSVDLATYYTRRRELAVQAAQAEEQRIDTVVAALERERAVAKTPETREVADSKLSDAVEQQVKASAEAARAQARIRREEQRDQFQTGQRLIEQEAELAQLRGDDARATAIRNQLAVVEFARVNERAGGPQSRVTDFAELIRQQSTFNDLQTQSSVVAERISNVEENYIITAQARGDTQEQIERGLFALRQQQLGQLELLVIKARELADASTDPKIGLFVDQLALQFRRVAEEIDPAVQKLRDAGDEVADAFGKVGGAISLNFKNAETAIKSLADTVARVLTREIVEKPLTDFARTAIRGSTEGGGGLAATARQIFGIGGGGGLQIDTSGAGTVDPIRNAASDSLRAFDAAAAESAATLTGLGKDTSVVSQVMALLPTAAVTPTTAAMTTLSSAAVVPATAALTAMTAAATSAAAALSAVGASGGASAASGLLDGFDFGSFDFDFGTIFSGADGGYTGRGAKYQAAGIVHAEEFVNRREVVAQPGALPFLERFNKVGMQAVDESFIERIRASAGDPTQILPMMRAKAAMPGFADGGYVGTARSFADGGYVGSRGTYFPDTSRREEPAETRQQARAQGGMQVHIYNNNGSKVETRERETEDGTVLEVFIDQVQAKLIERTARGGGLDSLMAGRYGLNPGSNARR
jgi:phage-related minor tail protein